MSNAWMHVVVRELRPGAEYEGKLYDQDVVVEAAGGELLSLFDMAPMIGAALGHGQPLSVVVALSAPIRFHRPGRSDCALEAISVYARS